MAPGSDERLPGLMHGSVHAGPGTPASCLMYCCVYQRPRPPYVCKKTRKNIRSGKASGKRGAGWIPQQPAGPQRSGGGGPSLLQALARTFTPAEEMAEVIMRFLKVTRLLLIIGQAWKRQRPVAGSMGGGGRALMGRQPRRVPALQFQPRRDKSRQNKFKKILHSQAWKAPALAQGGME